LKPVIFRRGREKREKNGGDEPKQGSLYIYIWKYHNETPCTMNIH
jgi:hypothetical protein